MDVQDLYRPKQNSIKNSFWKKYVKLNL